MPLSLPRRSSRSSRSPAPTAVGVALCVLAAAALAACSDDEPGNNRITRIDGPATVDEDVGADVDPGDG
ncbi:MAG: hypothetical protein AAFP84_16490 [Actinomycetota bacterium]